MWRYTLPCECENEASVRDRAPSTNALIAAPQHDRSPRPMRAMREMQYRSLRTEPPNICSKLDGPGNEICDRKAIRNQYLGNRQNLEDCTTSLIVTWLAKSLTSSLRLAIWHDTTELHTDVITNVIGGAWYLRHKSMVITAHPLLADLPPRALAGLEVLLAVAQPNDQPSGTTNTTSALL
jgi:hypothetical protein